MVSTGNRQMQRHVPLGGSSGRTLHLLDLENMLGGIVTSHLVAEMWTTYEQLAPVAVGDHVIAGFGPYAAVEGVFALPTSVRKLVGTVGRDSADRVLIDAVDVDLTCRRFARVVISSVDGRFAPLAWALRSRGARVLFVDTKASAVSWMLYRSCEAHLTIPAPASVHRAGHYAPAA